MNQEHIKRLRDIGIKLNSMYWNNLWLHIQCITATKLRELIL